MRVSADRDDPAFREDLIGSDVVIECDGKVIDKVIAADDEAGTVLAYATGADGEIMLNELRDGAKMYELTGTVVIHLPPERLTATV